MKRKPLIEIMGPALGMACAATAGAQASAATRLVPSGIAVAGAPGALTPEASPVPGDAATHGVLADAGYGANAGLIGVFRRQQERYALGTPCHVPGGTTPQTARGLKAYLSYTRRRYSARTGGQLAHHSLRTQTRARKAI